MKPKKTAEELVQMLHDEKGIQFHLISEEQAVECFSQRNNYLRTASYRKNYPKHIAGPNAGKYIHLEFAYLAELSTLDFYLRELLLQMCILKRVIFCASAVTDVARIFFCLRRCVEFRYRPATHPIHFAAVSPDKIIAALHGRYFSFSQIKSYVVVQSSKICFWLLTAQL